MAEQSMADFFKKNPPPASAVAPTAAMKADTGKSSTEVTPMPLAPAIPPALTANAPLATAMPLEPVEFDKMAGLPTAKEKWYEDPTMAARAFLDGMVFGFSDEIGAGIAASAAALTSDDPSASWSGIYNDMMKSLENERRVYTSNHVGATLGLGIAGAVASPLNKPLGWLVGKATPAIATGADTFGTITGLWAPRAQRALGAMEARAANALPAVVPGEIKTVLPTAEAVNYATGTFRALPARNFASQYIQDVKQALPSAILGGAIYGGGATEQGGNRMEGAAQGAALGAVATPLFQTLPVVAKALTAPKVAQPLDIGGGKFVPLTLAAGVNNPITGWIYRNVVGRSFVGKDMLSSQATRYLTPLYAKIDAFGSRLAAAKKLTGELKEAVAKRAETALKEATTALRESSAGKIRSIRKDFKARIDKIKQDAATAEVVTSQFPAVFRSQAMHNAIPDSFPAEVKQGIQDAMEQGDYLTANARMREAWNKYGFDMLNKNTFQLGDRIESFTQGIQPKKVSEVSFEKIANRVAGTVNREDLIYLTTSGNKLDFVKEQVIGFLKEVADENGRVKGTSLATLRNMISGLMRSSSIAGDSASKGNETALRNIYIELKNVLDDEVKKQLSPEAVTAFEAHQKAYRVRLAMDQAITNAAVKERGAFTPEGWLQSLASLFRKDVGEGKAPLQEAAFDAAKSIINAEEATKSLAKEAQAIMTQQTVQAMDEMEIALLAERARLKAEVAALRGTKNVTAAEMLKASRSGAITSESALMAKEQQLAELKQTRSTLLSILPHKGNSEGVTPGEAGAVARMLRLLTFNVLPYAFGFTAIPATMATQWFQRIVAGQSLAQRILDKAGKTATVQEAQRALPAAIGGQSVTDPQLVRFIMSKDKGEKANIYRAMKASGSFDSLKKTKPELARMLEESAK